MIAPLETLYLIPGTRVLERNDGVVCDVHSAGRVPCVTAVVLHTVIRLSLGRRLVNLSPVAQRTIINGFTVPTAVSAPQVSRPRELKHVWQTRRISLSPSGSATPHVPWRYFPQTSHGWF